MKEIKVNGVEETVKVAEDFAGQLKRGDVILLNGEMGAGKTHFVKGLAKGLGITEEVTSPTYAYLNVYDDFLFHYDCYRLSSYEDALRLGLNDYFGEDCVCVIEWSENIKELIPDYAKTVEIEITGENTRTIRFL